MKVTVMSPVTAEVTIAQASAWLERNGWESRTVTVDSQLFRHREYDEWTSVPVPGCSRVERRLAETVEEAATTPEAT